MFPASWSFPWFHWRRHVQIAAQRRATRAGAGAAADPLAASPAGSAGRVYQFLEPGEPGGVVGAIVARFPPVLHRVKEVADLLAGSNAEPGDIMSGEREDWRDPIAGEGEEVGEALPTHRSFRRQQQGDVTISPAAAPSHSLADRPPRAARDRGADRATRSKNAAVRRRQWRLRRRPR